ncbi:ATP-binding protein [Methylocella sp.]|uniref:ATP-binding protein n=1 Tax=Methylocella sp. TaxID=1978226 RepID=UPI003783D189
MKSKGAREAPRARGGEGAGLGLSIVRRIAERAGGELNLRNVDAGEGHGFRASLALPLASLSRLPT